MSLPLQYSDYNNEESKTIRKNKTYKYLYVFFILEELFVIQQPNFAVCLSAQGKP